MKLMSADAFGIMEGIGCKTAEFVILHMKKDLFGKGGAI